MLSQLRDTWCGRLRFFWHNQCVFDFFLSAAPAASIVAGAVKTGGQDTIMLTVEELVKVLVELGRTALRYPARC
jgi:hypothetical protein